jgi:hypothetical protein
MSLTSGCGCTSSTTSPCDSTQGCTEVTYTSCVLYNGSDLSCSGTVLIDNGATLNEVITNLHERICTLTPEDLDYSAFALGCMDDSAAISTTKEFAEKTAEMLCAVYYPNPSGLCADLFDATAGDYPIDATSTLTEVLEAYGNVLCAHEDLLEKFDITNITSGGCCALVVNGSTTLSGIFNQLASCLCTINTTLTNSITTLTNNINTFVGPTTTIQAISYDITCLGVPNAAARLHTTVSTLLSVLCSAVTDITDLQTDVTTINTTLNSPSFSWGCLGAPGSPLTGSLVDSVQHIINNIIDNKVTFDSSQFNVVSTACGDSISLKASALSFSCSSLGTCSIAELADVDNFAGSASLTNASDTGKVLRWNQASLKWFATRLAIDDLSDVDTTTSAPSVSQSLQWNGTNWVPANNSFNGSTGLKIKEYTMNPCDFTIGATVSTTYTDTYPVKLKDTRWAYASLHAVSGGTYVARSVLIDSTGAYIANAMGNSHLASTPGDVLRIPEVRITLDNILKFRGKMFVEIPLNYNPKTGANNYASYTDASGTTWTSGGGADTLNDVGISIGTVQTHVTVALAKDSRNLCNTTDGGFDIAGFTDVTQSFGYLVIPIVAIEASFFGTSATGTVQGETTTADTVEMWELHVLPDGYIKIVPRTAAGAARTYMISLDNVEIDLNNM